MIPCLNEIERNDIINAVDCTEFKKKRSGFIKIVFLLIMLCNWFKVLFELRCLNSILA